MAAFRKFSVRLRNGVPSIVESFLDGAKRLRPPWRTVRRNARWKLAAYARMFLANQAVGLHATACATRMGPKTVVAENGMTPTNPSG